jgi:hypothetical protein
LSVTLAVSSGDVHEGALSTSSLSFHEANWNAAQTVTVTGVPDHQVDGDHAYTIEIGVFVSSDSNFNNELRLMCSL